MTDLVQVERRRDTSVVTLDRPEKLNALSMDLEWAILEALESPAVRDSAIVVIHGSGRAFSAGADLTEVRDLDASAIAAYYRESGRVYEALASLPQITISAIHGYCLGAGFELALASDLRVADEEALFGLPEVGLGILPSSGGLTRIVRAVGPLMARDLVLCGRQIGARRAYELGLVNEVVPVGAALERSVALADELAGLPGLAVEFTKQAIDAAAESSAQSARLLERVGYGMLNQTKTARAQTGAFGNGSNS